MTPIPCRDGTLLATRSWPVPEAAETCLLVHGLGEHVGRLAPVAERLNQAGWSVVGYDHRGHGQSGGARGALARDDDLLHDLATVIDAVRSQHQAPLLLLGDSMGGLVVARFAAEAAVPPASRSAWYRNIDGAVLVSPALDPGMNRWQKLQLAVLGALAPGLAAGNGLDPAWLSRDPAVGEAYRRDALTHDRITARLVRFVVDAGIVVRDRAASWTVPTLLIWAGADRCVAPAGSAAFAAAAPGGVVQARCFDGYAHELFNEPAEEAERVFQELEAWLAGWRERWAGSKGVAAPSPTSGSG